MLRSLSRCPDDPLLRLIELYRADVRPGKIDLGVGVYRDEFGATPVLRAVKSAEQLLLQSQTSKAYIGPEGDVEFLDYLWWLVAGGSAKHKAGVQTPGGCGALRLAAELIARSGGRRIWVGRPSWPNHQGIFESAGLEVAEFQFVDTASQSIYFDRVVSALERAQRGEALLLQASCHNPTGVPLSSGQWEEIATIVERQGLLPLIDLAYQGLGKGLEQDVAGLRILVERVPETLVAVSCSKSFALYRERTGAVYAICDSVPSIDSIRSNLCSIARTTYSMPPDHGAAVVRTILSNDVLRGIWAGELDTMRVRIF